MVRTNWIRHVTSICMFIYYSISNDLSSPYLELVTFLGSRDLLETSKDS